MRPCVLRFGITASNELSRLRAMLDEIRERRIDPTDALKWIESNDPLPASTTPTSRIA